MLSHTGGNVAAKKRICISSHPLQLLEWEGCRPKGRTFCLQTFVIICSFGPTRITFLDNILLPALRVAPVSFLAAALTAKLVALFVNLDSTWPQTIPAARSALIRKMCVGCQQLLAQNLICMPKFCRPVNPNPVLCSQRSMAKYACTMFLSTTKFVCHALWH